MSRILSIFKIPELRNKLLIIALIFFVFRVFAAIPIPSVDEVSLKGFLSSENQFLGLLNIFSGGALSRLSIVMLGLGPYITATIIMQVLMLVFPGLKAMYYEEGTQGRAKFNRYSRYLTVPFAAMQGYGFLRILMSQGALPQTTGWEMLVDVIVITAGSVLLVWLGEIITEQKMGNGVSLLIFAGIVADLPRLIRNAFATYTPGMLPTYIGFLIVGLIVIAGVVLVNEGERKVPISYARRIRGNKMYGGVASYLPLKVNQAGVIPIIFAVSLLMFPQVLAQMIAVVSSDLGAKLNAWVGSVLTNNAIYGTMYFLLVFIFTYFYTAVTFDPKEISKNLQRSGGFIPGIRPGAPTAQFMQSIISRITLFGALFLGIIAILPILLQTVTGTQALTIGGTAVLIVVSVTLETAKQIDSQLTVREYEGIR